MHPEYRAIWMNAGYPSDMGSAEVTVPPAPEFIRVYHVVAAGYGVSNISLQKLKVARFSDVNDPFELMAIRFKARSRTRLTEHRGLCPFRLWPAATPALPHSQNKTARKIAGR